MRRLSDKEKAEQWRKAAMVRLRLNQKNEAAQDQPKPKDDEFWLELIEE